MGYCYCFPGVEPSCKDYKQQFQNPKGNSDGVPYHPPAKLVTLTLYFPHISQGRRSKFTACGRCAGALAGSCYFNDKAPPLQTNPPLGYLKSLCSTHEHKQEMIHSLMGPTERPNPHAL
jgi:hypothetical protein